MWMNSKKDLIKEAKEHGYRPEILEKVYRLLDLVENFMAVPYLRERLVLKGGTAINLFFSEKLPRLSVDLDFNYVGSLDRETMRKEKIELETVILDICYRRRYELYRNPRAHAGGKMVLMYSNILGNKGYLEIDLNYLFRIPLWPTAWRESPDWPMRTKMIVLDAHELAAGKLHALLGREASRDLFDSYRLLAEWPLDNEKLRLAFTVYAGMERDHWERISVDNVSFTVKDIRDRLIPVLQRENIPQVITSSSIEKWANQMTDIIKSGLSKVLPFRKNEIDFLNCLQQGEIKPELLSGDQNFCQRVKEHPSLHWRVRQAEKNAQKI